MTVCPPRVRPVVRVIFFLFAVFYVHCAFCAEKQEKPLPKFSEVKKTVLRYFTALPTYQPGGILARGEVEPVYDRLKQLGWRVPDWKSIVERIPAEESFLVQRLRTPDGRKFMTQICKYPQGYDRLDRTSRLARGEVLVDQFIRGPEGYKMIQYMTETEGGDRLGGMLSGTVTGKDFKKPTGQIYTVEMLLDTLKERYEKPKPASPGRPR